MYTLFFGQQLVCLFFVFYYPAACDKKQIFFIFVNPHSSAASHLNFCVVAVSLLRVFMHNNVCLFSYVKRILTLYVSLQMSTTTTTTKRTFFNCNLHKPRRAG